MKKLYTKPEITFEDFTLNTSIAGDCEVKTHTPAAEQCGIAFGDINIFLDGHEGCTTTIIDGSKDFDGLCYHVPTETNNLFNS